MNIRNLLELLKKYPMQDLNNISKLIENLIASKNDICKHFNNKDKPTSKEFCETINTILTSMKQIDQITPKQYSGVLHTIESIIGSILYFPIILLSYIFSFFPKIF